ncbi:hypothetical protein RvY_07441 [Ramazzottius varieornatus]|uniref:Uncharacterized protein n=1 Tax=Ramazzottius varieornatus TaxID=947166 RepID=A0A1D1VBP0_RAMVA|nr:hypothetical protein RvY_07441 [Ramazzottius varieornatus]
MLKQRKKEVQRRRMKLEQEKKVIAREIRDTAFKLYNAATVELDVKKILSELRTAKTELDADIKQVTF